MSVNNMSFEQISTILNDIQEQVTGRKSIAPVNTSEFISVANNVLKNGYDPVLNSINQMITKTIFSIRPYSRKFAGLQVDEQRYGAITRKLNIADKPFEDNNEFILEDGAYTNPFYINKPNILQMNFYGSAIYEKSYSIFKDSLNNAFTGPEQLAEFISMTTQNASDMVEQAHEDTARMTIANFIAGKISGDEDSVVHLLTEYNELTGLSLDEQSVYQPENFKPFMEWVHARIEEISLRMTERSQIYQINVEGKPIMRHTPRQDQKVYLYAPAMAQLTSRVLASEYHDTYLKYADHEAVTFWQNILTPDSISITPTYLTPTGDLTTGENVEASKIFGVIFDRDAMGYTVVNQWSATTPLEAKHGFWTTFLHFTEKYWNDFTEKGVILMLD